MGIAAGIDFQVPQTGTRLFDTLTRPHWCAFDFNCAGPDEPACAADSRL